MADLTLSLLADASRAQGAFKDFGAAVTAAGAIVKEFVGNSMKAYAEAERVQRQLSIAAGQYTDALSEQAEVMAKKYAIDDDDLKHLDVLLLRYGAAPAAIKGTTEAILDYAAATGKDATQAMEQLIRGVESGTGSLGRMGVHFKTTGDFSTDLAAAVTELNKKFGGAGEADAKGLDGRMRSVSNSTETLMENFGEFFDMLDRRTGALDGLTRGIDAVALGMKRVTNLFANNSVRSILGLVGRGALGDLEPLSNALTAGEDTGPGLALPTTPLGGEHRVGGGKTKGPKEKDDWGWGPFGNPEESYDGWLKEYQEYSQKQLDELEKDRLEARRRDDEFRKKELEEEEKHDEKMLELKRKESDLELDLLTKHQGELDQKFKQQEEQWRRAGDSMGAALVNAIGDQLLRLAEGGDVDPAAMAGDIAATILGIAGAAIGTYFGAPQLGAAIGGFAGGVAKVGIGAAFGRKKHDGGWIERFHSGGWPVGGDEVPIIAQTGERVLSRREVGAMGGPAAVEAAARGRGGNTYNISALDSQSFMDSMGDRGGRGFFDAIRVGRGDLAPLFS